MAARKPPPLPTQDPDDLLAEPVMQPDTVPSEDGLVLPAIPDDPEHDRMVDPED